MYTNRSITNQSIDQSYIIMHIAQHTLPCSRHRRTGHLRPTIHQHSMLYAINSTTGKHLTLSDATRTECHVEVMRFGIKKKLFLNITTITTTCNVTGRPNQTRISNVASFNSPRKCSRYVNSLYVSQQLDT